MRRILTSLAALAGLSLAGCVIAPAPREQVVDREVVDSSGNVVQRDRVVEEAPSPGPVVEVVPVRPFFGAVWIPGFWGFDGYHHRYYRRGHWR